MMIGLIKFKEIDIVSGFYDEAAEKLNKEKNACGSDNHVSAMKNAVCAALIEFCKQDEEFSQAVVQGGSFKDCMAAVAKNAGSSLSDLEAYQRAVKFYFPGAGVHFEMRIDLCAEVNDNGSVTNKDGLLISLDSFFD